MDGDRNNSAREINIAYNWVLDRGYDDERAQSGYVNSVNIIHIQKYLEDLPANLDKEFNALKMNLNTQQLEKRFERKINRTLASQAALANLFQPYSVGKLNLTAAVGGYKSEHAVAIGTGYRFNERFAARASVSFVRGGSATYGAGINFEY